MNVGTTRIEFDPVDAMVWTADVLDAYAALPWPDRVLIARTLSLPLKLMVGGMLFDRERQIVCQRVECLLPDADADVDVKYAVTGVAMAMLRR